MIETDGPIGPRASNGQPYVTLVSGGVKEEGADYPFLSELEPGNEAQGETFAWTTFNGALMEFVGDAKKIEWRTRPMLEHVQGVGQTRCAVVWSRLAVIE